MKKNLGKIALVVVPLVFAVILLYPTYKASQLEKKEKEAFAEAAKANNSEDSLAIMDNFYKVYGEALASAKRNRLKLGLDLRGGMYVTLEVDIARLIVESAQSEAIDDIFNEVVQKTISDQKNSDAPVIDIFLKNFDAIARPKGKTLLNYFETHDFRDVSEDAIIKRLHSNADQAIDQAQEVIRQRIDQYGVSEPNIQKSGARRIVLELPGVQNRDEMMSLLQTTARLEFHLVRNNETIVRAFSRIDKYLHEQNKRKQGIEIAEEVQNDTTVTETVTATETVETAEANIDNTVENDTVNQTAEAGKPNPNNPYEGLSDEEARKRYLEDHPFTTLFSTFYYQGTGDHQQLVNFGYIGDEIPEGNYMFRIDKDSIVKFNLLLQRPDIKVFLPIDLIIAIDAKPDQRLLRQANVEIFDFYALKREPELTGDVIVDARATFDPTTNAPVVSMQMNSDGAESWARITGANVGKRIAIVLDDRVYSAPNVINKISGGNSQITGMANAEEAHLLEIVLKAGALKAPIQIIEERVVGPSLGQDSIDSGVMASLAAALLVVLFMLLYYSSAGAVADIAVLINVTLILAVLAALGGTLTLPGIAGIILTMGMAVDANVLIFERIREELARGRSMRAAIDDGFAKAMRAIIDTNLTTFIVAVILYYFGTGPIQGFALTLLIGVLGTLFTGVFVSKALIELFVSKTGSMSFGQPKIKLSTNI